MNPSIYWNVLNDPANNSIENLVVYCISICPNNPLLIASRHIYTIIPYSWIVFLHFWHKGYKEIKTVIEMA
jgi:hypothetical protein